MERHIYTALVKWKNRADRKPLVLLGARQVGKTYILKELGRKEFKSMVYVNCHKNPFAATLFRDMNVHRMVTELERYYETTIEPGSTLLVFDEVQEVPDGIAAMKYFCEDLPSLHVAVAGSLLGITLRQGESYPVGKVTTMRMYPMTFLEYLRACDRPRLVETLLACNWESMAAMDELLVEHLRQYYFVGGMPEAVKTFISTGDTTRVREVQHEILDAYERDISKHTQSQVTRIHQVWNSIAAQLARENKKFIFGAVKKGGRAADFELAIQWLVDAGLVCAVQRVKETAAPLKFYADYSAFKLYLLDCGLLACLCEASPKTLLLGTNAFTTFKGAFTENYVLQQLIATGVPAAYYFSKDNSSMEIDFLFQHEERVVPVEVKAEVNVKSKSLSQFVNVDNAGRNLKALRFSMRPHIDQGWVENIPLYAVEAFLRSTL
ncbi:MAG: ATP-binding protein [Muribaculaceae bacterium]|nr:ATP-binding protein [Muribaculaceae bacterium]